MIFHWHRSQVFCLGNCVDDTPTEIGLMGEWAQIRQSILKFSDFEIKTIIYEQRVSANQKPNAVISFEMHALPSQRHGFHHRVFGCRQHLSNTIIISIPEYNYFQIFFESSLLNFDRRW